MNEEDISELFELAVRSAGLRSGRRLGHGNEYVIPQMARDAAASIVALAPNDPARWALIRKGEAGFRLFGEEMVQAAERIPSYPDDIIGEDSRVAALAALGPFPPFR